MSIGLIIIGDEILSGKRADQHFPKVVQLLAARGLQLAWAEVLGDDRERITATLRRTFATNDIVFSCGGIGATPDDHTRQAAAAALDRSLVLHPQAADNIRQRILQVAREAGQQADLNAPEHLQRLQMAEFPLGAELIPNPYNNVAGFAVDTHYFVPGFPVMAWPMIEWVLDTHHAHLFNREARAERAVLVYEAAESALTPLMVEIEATWPQVKVFSLPSVGDARTRRHIELGVKGAPEQVEAAFARLCAGLDAFGAEYTLSTPGPL
ncbi:molybdopterin-biosynthesis enzyme MoeA-like protein [Pseudoduganella flava]|uniref:Competence/damage-inducible protein A n=1 Tax=Pseudoduganella flava TaxID=871742 RepID=A0A562Q3S5_9BURK|nr:molybdopterin-binding protein [Pseudoduganella flava]QGZ41450.1 competence/damage-inducible protein A [Pseudoduganella flava]TWI51405.1 molybdopterin-biosynthesis enzyme MoeA-like protein [Pseudoduganella flava]